MNLIAWIAILIVLVLIIYEGIGFIRRSRKIRKENVGQASFLRGMGLFMISIAISQIVYISDVIARELLGGRIFGSEYNFATVINRDYSVVIFFVVLFSAAFLIYPLEHYLLERKRNLFTIITAIAVPMPPIIRLSEYALDVNLTINSPLYIIFSILWYILIAIIASVITILVVLYIQVGRIAPKGSPAMKKSIAIIFGFFLWGAAVFLTPFMFRHLESFEGAYYKFVYPFIIPIILVIALKLIRYGYSTTE